MIFLKVRVKWALSKKPVSLAIVVMDIFVFANRILARLMRCRVMKFAGLVPMEVLNKRINVGTDIVLFFANVSKEIFSL